MIVAQPCRDLFKKATSLPVRRLPTQKNLSLGSKLSVFSNAKVVFVTEQLDQASVANAFKVPFEPHLQCGRNLTKGRIERQKGEKAHWNFGLERLKSVKKLFFWKPPYEAISFSFLA